MFNLNPEIFVPLIIFSIPIVAIMAGHQQKMARIIRGQGDEGLRQDVEMLKQEVIYLRGVVHSQSMALEAVRQQNMAASGENLTQRLS